MKLKSLLILGIAILIYTIIAVLLTHFEDERCGGIGHGTLLRQAIIYQDIQRYKEVLGEVPLHLEELSKVGTQKLDYLLKEVDSYNPDVWGDPQKILLLKYKGGYYYTTFGDGSGFTLKQYRKWQGKPKEINYLDANIYWPGKITELLIYGGIAITTTMIVSNRFRRKTKLSESSLQDNANKNTHSG